MQTISRTQYRILMLLVMFALVVGLAGLAGPTRVAQAIHSLGINLDDGSASAPTYSFTDDTDTGMYRIGTNNAGMAANGTLVMDWNGTSTDANSLPITNVGAAGTDFSNTGGLTLADGLTVTTGGVTVSAGGITGTLNTAAQTSVTSLGTLSALTVTGTGITGTLNTAAQPNITSVGTLPTATITNLTGTSITGTLQTASQPNVTNLGTQQYLTATTFTLGGIAQAAAKHVAASAVVSGTTVAHTLGTTPTIAICQPNDLQATTYTQTLYAHSFNATSATIGVSQGAVSTFAAVSCLFGK